MREAQRRDKRAQWNALVHGATPRGIAKRTPREAAAGRVRHISRAHERFLAEFAF